MRGSMYIHKNHAAVAYCGFGGTIVFGSGAANGAEQQRGRPLRQFFVELDMRRCHFLRSRMYMEGRLKCLSH